MDSLINQIQKSRGLVEAGSRVAKKMSQKIYITNGAGGNPRLEEYCGIYGDRSDGDWELQAIVRTELFLGPSCPEFTYRNSTPKLAEQFLSGQNLELVRAAILRMFPVVVEDATEILIVTSADPNLPSVYEFDPTTDTSVSSPEDPPWPPASHWDNHPRFPHSDWVAEVNDNATRQSYVEWVSSQIAIEKEESDG